MQQLIAFMFLSTVNCKLLTDNYKQ